MEVLHNRKAVVSFLVTALIFIVVLCLFLAWHEMRIKKIDVDKLELQQTPDELVLTVKDAYYQGGSFGGENLLVDGWCLIRGRISMPVAIHVLLRDEDTDEYYMLPTNVEVSEEAKAAFADDGVEYDYSGFRANLRCRKLKLDQRTYEVVILYQLGDDVYLAPSGEYMKAQ